MNTIEIDEKGVFAYEAPEITKGWSHTEIRLDEQALEAAKRDRVYFKPEDVHVRHQLYNDLILDVDKGEVMEQGKPYPVPEGYEVKICVEPNLRTQSSKKYAILVSKRNDPVINEYHSTEKCKSQAGIFEEDFGAKIEGDDGTLPSKTILPFGQSIEEAELLIPFPDEKFRDGKEIHTWQKGWEAGVKSQAAKKYWYEQFKKEKL